MQFSKTTVALFVAITSTTLCCSSSIYKKHFETLKELRKSKPAINETKNKKLLRKGFALYSKGKLKEAEKVWFGAAKANITSGVTFYNLACVNALLGNGKPALGYLRIALKLDSSEERLFKMMTDKDLASVRELDAFQKLAKKYKIRKAAPYLIGKRFYLPKHPKGIPFPALYDSYETQPRINAKRYEAWAKKNPPQCIPPKNKADWRTFKKNGTAHNVVIPLDFWSKTTATRRATFRHGGMPEGGFDGAFWTNYKLKKSTWSKGKAGKLDLLSVYKMEYQTDAPIDLPPTKEQKLSVSLVIGKKVFCEDFFCYCLE